MCSSLPANMYDFGFLAPCPASGLIVHGERDTVTPTEAVTKLVNKLSQQRGITIDFETIEGADHFFNKHLAELDSIHENGAKLIEALPSDIPALRNSTPGVRIIPEVFYFPAVVAPPLIARRMKLATAVAPSVRIELNVVDARTGAGVRGATVVAFTDLATETGAQGTTNAQG